MAASETAEKCAMCDTTEAYSWEKNEVDETLCNVCVKSTAQNTNVRRSSITHPARKSLRVAAAKQKGETCSKLGTSSGKARRKGAPNKINYEAAPAFAVPVLRPMLHNGVFFQHGDIVSLPLNKEELCYAQIRGLFRDQYGEKYAVITWLFPTTASPKGYFDPDTYLIGPDEDMPRKMTYMQFVCNPPNDRYLLRGQTSPIFPPIRAEFGVLYKKTGPEIVPLLPPEAYFNPHDKLQEEDKKSWRYIEVSLPEPKRGRRGPRKR